MVLLWRPPLLVLLSVGEIVGIVTAAATIVGTIGGVVIAAITVLTYVRRSRRR